MKQTCLLLIILYDEDEDDDDDDGANDDDDYIPILTIYQQEMKEPMLPAKTLRLNCS